MKTTVIPSCAAVVMLMGAAPAFAITLQELAVNINGTLTDNGPFPASVSTALDAAGLGTVTYSDTSGVAGSRFFDIFFDYQVSTPVYDEFGSVIGAPGAGVSWQIDVPGAGDANRVGTIFTNVTNNTLDNANHVSGTTSNSLNTCGANGGGGVNATCNNNVSLAMGFNYIVAAGEEALITLTISTTMPAGGFFLQQTHPGTQLSVYLSGALVIQPLPPPAPNGDTCITMNQCQSTNCVDRVCCDTACTDPFEACNIPGRVGTCSLETAVTPAISTGGLVIAVLLLVGVAGIALSQRRRTEAAE